MLRKPRDAQPGCSSRFGEGGAECPSAAATGCPGTVQQSHPSGGARQLAQQQAGAGHVCLSGCNRRHRHQHVSQCQQRGAALLEAGSARSATGQEAARRRLRRRSCILGAQPSSRTCMPAAAMASHVECSVGRASTAATASVQKAAADNRQPPPTWTTAIVAFARGARSAFRACKTKPPDMLPRVRCGTMEQWRAAARQQARTRSSTEKQRHQN